MSRKEISTKGIGLGSAVSRLREFYAVSYMELAQQLGVSRVAVFRYFSGQRGASNAQLCKIKSILRDVAITNINEDIDKAVVQLNMLAGILNEDGQRQAKRALEQLKQSRSSINLLRRPTSVQNPAAQRHPKR